MTSRLKSIFKDKDKLSPHYIPQTLPHRERHLEVLRETFREVIGAPSKAHLRIVQIIGPVGTGKTSTAIRFGDILEAEAKKAGVSLNHLYANLKIHGGSRVIFYRYLAQRLTPEIYSASLGAEELLYQFVGRLTQTSRRVLLTLDEIDYFLKHSKEPRVVYDLTRLDELVRPGEPCGVVGVIFIGRTREFYKLLDQAEVSTLGRIPIEFSPYTADQISSILSNRVTEAFFPEAVPQETVRLISDVTAESTIGGDVRYALDLLLFAGELADRERAYRVEPEHVRRIMAETVSSITREDVVNLPLEGKMVLLAVARALRTRKSAYVSLRNIREAYEVVCEEKGVKPSMDFEEHVQDLHDRGMIEIRSLTEIGISGVSTEVLGTFLDGLLKRLGESIGLRGK